MKLLLLLMMIIRKIAVFIVVTNHIAVVAVRLDVLVKQERALKGTCGLHVVVARSCDTGGDGGGGGAVVVIVVCCCCRSRSGR